MHVDQVRHNRSTSWYAVSRNFELFSYYLLMKNIKKYYEYHIVFRILHTTKDRIKMKKWYTHVWDTQRNNASDPQTFCQHSIYIIKIFRNKVQYFLINFLFFALRFSQSLIQFPVDL